VTAETDYYYVSFELLNDQGELITAYRAGTATALRTLRPRDGAVVVSHAFEPTANGGYAGPTEESGTYRDSRPRFVRVELGGKDGERWLGAYGATFSDWSVTLVANPPPAPPTPPAPPSPPSPPPPPPPSPPPMRFCSHLGCSAVWDTQASNGAGTCGSQISWVQAYTAGMSEWHDACQYVAAHANTPECAPCFDTASPPSPPPANNLTRVAPLVGASGKLQCLATFPGTHASVRGWTTPEACAAECAHLADCRWFAAVSRVQSGYYCFFFDEERAAPVVDCPHNETMLAANADYVVWERHDNHGDGSYFDDDSAEDEPEGCAECVCLSAAPSGDAACDEEYGAFAGCYEVRRERLEPAAFRRCPP
jgi:hypothetical protein